MLKRIGWTALALAFCLLPAMQALPAGPALAAPPAQGDCAGNLLTNSGFEGGFSTRGAGEVEVANGWDPWWHNGSDAEVNNGLLRRPEYKAESLAAFGSRRIHSGAWAQKWFSTYATHTGGIMQHVSVPADSVVTLSAWVQVWSSSDPNPDTVVNPGNYHVSVGVDPTGGMDGDSGNIVWSAEVVQYNAWIHLTVQAKARGGAVTVFLRGRPEYRVVHNDSYWDDACLTAEPPTPVPTVPPPPTNTPRPTFTPTVTSTPSRTPTATATSTPLPGTIRVSAFQDYNANGVRDAGDALLPGAVFTVTLEGGAVAGTYTTDGLSEPYAFQNLRPGKYTVVSVPPMGYAPVGTSAWPVAVAPGQSVDVNLAANFLPTPSATPRRVASATPAAPTPVPTATVAAKASVGDTIYRSSGLLVMGLGVVMLGLVVAVTRRRRPGRTG